jgi:hypothetical protein
MGEIDTMPIQQWPDVQWVTNTATQAQSLEHFLIHQVESVQLMGKTISNQPMPSKNVVIGI